MDTFEQLWAVTKALEKRFPGHNGPFEYATRMTEEVGELIEVLYEIHTAGMNNDRKTHLVKEQQDVIRTAFGIAAVYALEADFSTKFTFDYPDGILERIVFLGIASGELANAVNHAEGMGIKKEKHGKAVHHHVLEKAQKLVEIVLSTVQLFDVQAEFDSRATANYQDNQARGFIDR